MLNEHYREVIHLRNRLREENGVLYKSNEALPLLDAVLALLKHAAETDARLREHQGDPHAHELIP